MREKRTICKYLLKYTIVFALFCAGAFWVFALAGKSFVWNQDGGTQYVPYLSYMGSYLRDFLRRAFHGDFTIQMFDFTIGYGDDVGSVVRAHPLDFLSVFVPSRYTEQLYVFLIFLRMYLAGLSFSLYCRYWHLPENDILTGSMIYAFCGYVLRFGIVHPTFMSPFIFLPLVLLGAEKMMRRDGWKLFSFSVFLGFVSNYYFMYMCAVALALYALIRYPFLYKTNRIRQFFPLLIRMLAAFLLGTAMAMATLLPVIYMLRSSARLSSDSGLGNLWWYSSSRWRNLIVDFIAPKLEAGEASHMNFAAIVLPAAVMLFFDGRKETHGLKCGMLLEYVMLLLPAAAYLMTMMSTTNNRWMFVVAFTTALVYTVEADRLRHLSAKQVGLLAAAFVLYTLLALKAGNGKLGVYRTFAVRMLALCILICAVCSLIRSLQKAAVMLTGLSVFLCVCGNAYYLYSENYGNFTAQFLDRGTSLSMILDSEFAWINRIEDDSFYRVDTNLVTSNKENYSLLLGYNSTSQYNSLISGPMTYEFLETESIGIGAIHRFQGLDSRPAAEALANVKYYFTTGDGEKHVPYGFERVDELSENSYAVYKNTMPLSFGITYDTWMSRDAYLELDGAGREFAQLKYAVTQEQPAGVQEQEEEEPEMEYVTADLPAEGDKAERTETGYKASKNASITIPYEKRAGYQCYLHLTGFSNKKIYTFIHVDTSDLHTLMLIRGPGTIYSLNRTDYMINLGYDTADAADTVTLGLTKKASYNLKGIEFIYIPMDSYEELIGARNDESLENVSFGINRVSGTVSVTGTKVMQFSIPYSSGWQITVDGKKQDALQVNTAWLGTVLTEGDHSIVLTYMTPGAFAGRILAVAGWLLFLGACIRDRRRKGAGVKTASAAG